VASAGRSCRGPVQWKALKQGVPPTRAWPTCVRIGAIGRSSALDAFFSSFQSWLVQWLDDGTQRGQHVIDRLLFHRQAVFQLIFALTLF
jgi:hypothetical protein